ncbi:jacalin-related lectin 19 [Aristolochia californica]|uniref:jacalin-related lectin 19 n=1 Tax=Aristolochia californica TaxID=171875 RepID=UPI0035DD76B8
METQKKKNSETRKNIVVGPWGGNGGTPWDDGSFTGVREITLVYDRCIDSIRVLYDKSGRPFLAEKHGGNGGSLTARIKLQLPEEFLTSVSGYYSPMVKGGTPVIRSLTLKTNQRSIGPFGVEEGTPFTFPMDGGLIVGFRGRSGWYLDAIGFGLSRHQTTSIFELMQQKLKKLGRLASISARQDNEEHASQAKIAKSHT